MQLEENRFSEELNTIPEFSFRGIRRIEIPKTDNEFVRSETNFGAAAIKKYLPIILSAHNKNKEKIDYYYNYYLGCQDILHKERLYKKDAINNNKVVENHANRQVEFKVGYINGEEQDYTHKASTEKTDDLAVLDRYFTNQRVHAKNNDKFTWIFATGIGATYTAPRTDIIVSDGIDELTGREKTRYANIADGFNIETQAPFEYYCIDPRDNFVVYSSRFDKQPLFCVSIVDIDVSAEKANIPEVRKEIHIETRYASFVWESDINFSSFFGELRLVKVKTLRYLPIIEWSVNSERIGVVEKLRSLYNLVNTLKSAIADSVVDNSNVILVFKNTDIDGEQIRDMKAAGAVVISDSQNARQGSQASLDTIKFEMPLDGLNTFYEETVTQMYDIAGVPLASGQVTSGGDTGQARLLGGGWNNAYIIVNKDIGYVKQFDYDELELILYLCRQVPNCPLNELYESQIDIQYNINQNDNLLVKTQGIMNLYNVNMPKEEIVKVSGLFNDVTTVARKWQEYDDKVKAADKTEEEITVDETKETTTTSNGEKNSNNSQE